MGVETGDFGHRISNMGEIRKQEENSDNVHFLVSKIRSQQKEIVILRSAMIEIMNVAECDDWVIDMCREALELADDQI